MIMTKPGYDVTLSVPDHDVLDPGTLRALIRDAKLTIEEFIELL